MGLIGKAAALRKNYSAVKQKAKVMIMLMAKRKLSEFIWVIIILIS